MMERRSYAKFKLNLKDICFELNEKTRTVKTVGKGDPLDTHQKSSVNMAEGKEIKH